MAPPTPWRSILTSVPVWMLWVTLSVQDMAYFTFLANIPTYLDGVLNISVEEVSSGGNIRLVRACIP